MNLTIDIDREDDIDLLCDAIVTEFWISNLLFACAMEDEESCARTAGMHRWQLRRKVTKMLKRIKLLQQDAGRPVLRPANRRPRVCKRAVRRRIVADEVA